MSEGMAEINDDVLIGEQAEEVRQLPMETAVELVCQMLEQSEGCVSSTALRRELEASGIDDSRSIIQRLRLAGPETVESDGKPRFYHRGRSFYSHEAFLALEAATEREAEKAESIDEPGIPTQGRKRRAEEARLVTYVKATLEELYSTDYGPEDSEYVFDVHNDRPGGDMENVDVLAVLWRSNRLVDLVTVEVKLDFNARAVQQASNYSRFSDRVWIAVPVCSEPEQAAVELQSQDSRLYDYVVGRGLGVLACRRSLGRSYKVFPIQWPRRTFTDPVERDEFVDRHRSCFERAGVVPPEGAQGFPLP